MSSKIFISKVTETKYPVGTETRIDKDKDYDIRLSILPIIKFRKVSMDRNWNKWFYALSINWFIWNVWIDLYSTSRSSKSELSII